MDDVSVARPDAGQRESLGIAVNVDLEFNILYPEIFLAAGIYPVVPIPPAGFFTQSVVLDRDDRLSFSRLGLDSKSSGSLGGGGVFVVFCFDFLFITV